MWKFTPTQPTISTSGYNARDVFNAYDIMLNEGVQNSVDAGIKNNKPVHINISLSQVSKKQLETFLFENDTEKEHFKISKKIPSIKGKNITILKFEDYNTKGISGDIYDEKNGGSPMHAFLLSEGITSEEKRQGATGGSRGIGKSSFIYASEYHTFFMSTISEKGDMHLGRAYLEPKRCVNGTHYVKDAYFVQDASKDKIHSISGDKYQAFKNIFQLKRKEKGTSIIILSPKYDATKTDLKFTQDTVESIVKKYYFLFIQDILTVSISDSQGNTKEINKNNIYDYMESALFSSEYVFFIKNMYDPDMDIPQIEFKETRNTFKKTQDTFKKFIDCISESEKTQFLNYYHSGNIFKAVFPYWIDGRKEQVTFFIQKSDEKVTETHLRRHILHVGKSAKQMRDITQQKMFIGVDILAAPPTEITQQKLKDCEDENHQEWKIQYEFDKDNIRLTITKHIPEFLNMILKDNKNQKQETFYVFDDVFPIKPKKGTNTGKTGKTDPPDIDPPDTKTQDFNISKLTNGCGFSVTTNSKEVAEKLTIRVGYWQERKGTEQCIRNYKHYDFDVAHMDTDVSSANITYQKHNEIQLDNVRTNFKFTITGFDPIFDLVVDVKEGEHETNT